MSQMQLLFLGTGASYPTPARGPSSCALRRGGDIVLVDCGEGTQRQIMQSTFSFQDIDTILLTHYHGDHCYGVPGLLKTMALNERKKGLRLAGPRGLTRLVQAFRQMGGWPKEFPIEVLELSPGDTLELSWGQVTAFGVDHSVQTLAYRFEEHARPGKFNKPLALELGLQEGPDFGQIQRGHPVTLSDGTTIAPGQVLGPPRPGRTVAFSGDTQPCPELVELASGADVLVAESTFTSDQRERAREVKHLCADEAATVAKEAGVTKLILTHIGPRFKTDEPILEEATTIFEHVAIAHDLELFDVPYPA